MLGEHRVNGPSAGGGYRCSCGTPLTLGEHPTHLATMLAGARAEAGRAVVDGVELCQILRGVVTALDTRLTVDRAPTSARPPPGESTQVIAADV